MSTATVAEALGSAEAPDNLEWKISPSGIVGADDDGLMTVIVAVTGIVDGVNDVLVPGAFKATLQRRIPKGVWSHDIHDWVARTEAIEELYPGDPRLPTQWKGAAWPREAGALVVRTRFNLGTSSGSDAYSNVRFFDEGPIPNQVEFSIGYNSIPGYTERKAGKRYLHVVDLYEYCPVLFGAMGLAGVVPAASPMATKTRLQGGVQETKEHGGGFQTFVAPDLLTCELKVAGREVTPKDVAATDRLKHYWTHGAGAAKIRWGEPGDFNRCVRELSKYMPPGQVKGYCANRHKEATGGWPGHAPGVEEAEATAKKVAREAKAGVDDLEGKTWSDAARAAAMLSRREHLRSDLGNTAGDAVHDAFHGKALTEDQHDAAMLGHGVVRGGGSRITDADIERHLRDDHGASIPRKRPVYRLGAQLLPAVDVVEHHAQLHGADTTAERGKEITDQLHEELGKVNARAQSWTAKSNGLVHPGSQGAIGLAVADHGPYWRVNIPTNGPGVKWDDSRFYRDSAGDMMPDENPMTPESAHPTVSQLVKKVLGVAPTQITTSGWDTSGSRDVDYQAIVPKPKQPKAGRKSLMSDLTEGSFLDFVTASADPAPGEGKVWSDEARVAALAARRAHGKRLHDALAGVRDALEKDDASDLSTPEGLEGHLNSAAHGGDHGIKVPADEHTAYMAMHARSHEVGADHQHGGDTTGTKQKIASAMIMSQWVEQKPEHLMAASTSADSAHYLASQHLSPSHPAMRELDSAINATGQAGLDQKHDHEEGSKYDRVMPGELTAGDVIWHQNGPSRVRSVEPAEGGGHHLDITLPSGRGQRTTVNHPVRRLARLEGKSMMDELTGIEHKAVAELAAGEFVHEIAAPTSADPDRTVSGVVNETKAKGDLIAVGITTDDGGAASTFLPATDQVEVRFDPYAEIKSGLAMVAERKDYPYLPGSVEERQAQLRQAVRDLLMPEPTYDNNGNKQSPNCYVSVDSTFADYVVATINDYSIPGPDDEQSFAVPYSVGDDGEIQLGQPVPVEKQVVLVPDNDYAADRADLARDGVAAPPAAAAGQQPPAMAPLGGMNTARGIATKVQAQVKALLDGLEQKDGELSGTHVRRLKAAREAVNAACAGLGLPVDDAPVESPVGEQKSADPVVEAETLLLRARALDV